jgi:putative pyruvate formate lyase activating enzyme
VTTDWNDIRVSPTGEVTFLHLTPELLPLYRALGGTITCYPAPDREPHHCRLRGTGSGVPVAALPDVPEETLWAAQARRVGQGGANLLELKLELARRLLAPCRLCARCCPIDRRSHRGWCGVRGEEAQVFGVTEHYGEEPPLIPSLTVYLSGCNYRCSGCQTGADFEGTLRRETLAPVELAAQIDAAYRRGVWNVNFLGGEPSLHLPYILRVITACREPVFVVWNSNMHLTDDVLRILDGLVDYYLADLKFGNDHCARHVARIAPYWDVVTHAIEAAMQHPAEMIVRTLPLPGHGTCCQRPIQRYLARLGVRVSEQRYVPSYRDLGD